MSAEAHPVSVGALFTDIYGQHWNRDTSGRLARLSFEKKNALIGSLLGRQVLRVEQDDERVLSAVAGGVGAGSPDGVTDAPLGGKASSLHSTGSCSGG
jgi:hypothetical protein